MAAINNKKEMIWKKKIVAIFEKKTVFLWFDKKIFQ